jgi:transcription elongation factor Elf1
MAFTCPACGGEFESQDQLDAHTRADHGSGFRCPACGAEFESQDQLDEHARAEHGA